MAATLGVVAMAIAPAPRLAAQTPSGMPAWARTFFASEIPGEFAHGWLAKADRVRAAQAARARGITAAAPGTHYDLRGTFRTAVIAATYADRTPAVTSAALGRLLFGASAPNGYSLAQYYGEVSGGRFSFAGAVTPWIALPQPRSYYMDGFPANRRGRFADFLYDAISRADTTVDWRQFDNDGPDGVPNSGDDDGYVDLVIVAHPLADGVCRTDELAGPMATGYRLEKLARFGNHAYATHSIGSSGRPLLLDDFVLTAALDCDGRSLATVNILAHETGHALGLPDLYDRDFSSTGVGVWDLMGYGVYAAPGRPAMMGAWTRWQLGWGTQRAASAGWNTLPPAESSGVSLRIDVAGSSEFFLVENRQRVGADAALPSAGLLVWHVDADSLARHLPAYAAADNEAHPGIAVVRAGGAVASEAGDVFALPGVTSFGALTAPAASLWDGAFAGFTLDSMGTRTAGGLALFVSRGYAVQGADLAVTAADVMAQLLSPTAHLTRAQELAIDAIGNQNGALDVGDVVAWLERGPLAQPLAMVQHIPPHTRSPGVQIAPARNR